MPGENQISDLVTIIIKSVFTRTTLGDYFILYTLCQLTPFVLVECHTARTYCGGDQLA